MKQMVTRHLNNLAKQPITGKRKRFSHEELKGKNKMGDTTITVVISKEIAPIISDEGIGGFKVQVRI